MYTRVVRGSDAVNVSKLWWGGHTRRSVGPVQWQRGAVGAVLEEGRAARSVPEAVAHHVSASSSRLARLRSMMSDMCSAARIRVRKSTRDRSGSTTQSRLPVNLAAIWCTTIEPVVSEDGREAEAVARIVSSYLLFSSN